jgi:hypothetical protein
LGRYSHLRGAFTFFVDEKSNKKIGWRYPLEEKYYPYTTLGCITSFEYILFTFFLDEKSNKKSRLPKKSYEILMTA